jgi:5-methylcytosine-specific restriction enzyme subunit McrC
MVWRNALVEMLRYCGYLRARLPTWADLHLQRTPLLDLYLEAFLSEADEIVRRGLAKRYRRAEGNLNALKGRLVFREQVARNLLHKERFFTDHDRYDWDNGFNRVLKAATAITSVVAATRAVRSWARFLGLRFESVADASISEATFDRLRYDRKTERYRRAIALARLIILNYQPDVRAGSQNVLAILCDMNDLFEQYVFRRLRQAAARRPGVRVEGQRQHRFWSAEGVLRHVRPDIEVKAGSPRATVVLDTKWKVPSERYPADADLKQMFAYEERLEAVRGMLVYPRIDTRADVDGAFQPTGRGPARRCGMMFVRLFDENARLRPDIGDDILNNLAVQSAG